jgi:hypothetical protein
VPRRWVGLVARGRCSGALAAAALAQGGTATTVTVERGERVITVVQRALAPTARAAS